MRRIRRTPKPQREERPRNRPTGPSILFLPGLLRAFLPFSGHTDPWTSDFPHSASSHPWYSLFPDSTNIDSGARKSHYAANRRPWTPTNGILGPCPEIVPFTRK